MTAERRWHLVRIGALAVYTTVYLYWFRRNGIIIDRISVTISLVAFLVLANLGQPWRRWRQLALDLLLYSAMWFVYDETRGAADRLGSPLQVESVIWIDRVLFLGVDPTVWLQQTFYEPTSVRWYDVIASTVYYSHFVVPVVVIAVLWVTDRSQWVRFMQRFATVLAIACISFVVLPTAPPWMAAGGSRTYRLDALDDLARPTGRGWSHIGFDGFVHAWDTGRDWANPVAAMPSLHAAFSLFVVVFFLPRISAQWIRTALLAYPMAMALSLVYLAEHYVIDVLAGWAVVGASFWIWSRIDARRARRAAGGDRAPGDGANDSRNAPPASAPAGMIGP
jgi:membrane-associated phospholipid phosphatase